MKNFDKIIILVETPFNRRDYERFGVDAFCDNGLKVEVWEITPITRFNGYSHVTVPDPISSKKHRLFFSKGDIVNELKRCNSGTLIISYVAYRLETFFLFKAISRIKIPYSNVAGVTLPSIKISENLSFLSILKIRLLNLSLTKVFSKIFSLISCRWLGIKYPEYIIAYGGKASLKMVTQIKKQNTQILQAHSYDYDIYLKLKDRFFDIENVNYIVFLDEYFPFHPDYKLLNKTPCVKANDYYPALSTYFDYIEKKLNLKVIIAAHPKSHYDKHPGLFNGRQIIHNRTAELVKGAKLVLMHCSTAINFAVLFRKPILFLTSYQIESCIEYKMLIRDMASLLGDRTIVNIDTKNITMQENLFSTNENLYSKYEKEFINLKNKSNSYSWQIVIDDLKG